MGKRAGKFRHQNHGQKKQKKQWSSPLVPEENSIFRQYYQLQLKLPQEQFNVFWATMKEKLPVVFRINPSCPNFASFRSKVQRPDFVSSLVDESIIEEAEEVAKNQPTEAPKVQLLPWYPDNILYQINTTKQIFKKSKILNNLHKYLQKGFDAGLIARQELVSMLPPLFLDVQPDDIILDMCAAPGSKTSQLLQMQYGQQKGLKKGCVIANDADYSRAQMLIHQINRSGTAGMAVINHSGQFLPELYTTKINHIKQKFQFDKILCDVPCSGDGATRKLPIKWAKWHTSDGVSLHPLQLSILMKSINLLKKGGLIVYSTCSLNPIENEAVLSGLLKKVGKGLQLVDIHNIYAVKGRRGMFQWDVCTVETVVQKIVKNGQEIDEKIRRIKPYKSYEEAKQNYRLKQSMFPPSLQQAQKMNLHYSMRILPHDQNSGGFFVALLKKTDDFQWLYDAKKAGKFGDEKQDKNQDQLEQQFLRNNMPEVQNQIAGQEGDKYKKEQIQQSEGEGEGQQGEQKMEVQPKPQGEVKNYNTKGKKTNEYIKSEKFDSIDESQFEIIQKFFGLDPSLKKLLYVRDIEGTSKRKVLLISEGVQRFLEMDTQRKIKLINMGCKVLEKGKQSFAGYQCLYRLNQQGIHFLLPFMKERKVKVSLQFFRSVLSIHSLMHDDIKEFEIREHIKKMSQGSFCIYIEEQIEGKLVVDAIVGQNFKSSFHLMVGKQEIASLNLRYL